MSYHVIQTCWIIIWMSSVNGVPFCTDVSTVWTKTYVSGIHEFVPNQPETGTLFITSLESVAISSWLNTISQKEEHILLPGLRTTISITNDSSIPTGSVRKKRGLGLVTTRNVAPLFRDGYTFYQLREVMQLHHEYTVVSMTSFNEPLLSVIIISGLFDASTVFVTFKVGVDVPAILGDLITDRNTVVVSAKRIKFKNVSYGVVVKLQSNEDLTGTRILSGKQISVMSGAMSQQDTARFVYLDHLASDSEAGCLYIVFGLPETSGTDICRIVALSGNTEIDVNGVQCVTLKNTGDFYDVAIPRNSFRYLRSTNPVSVALFVKGDEPMYSDMMALQETSATNPIQYTFAIPSLRTDVNFTHYVIVATNSHSHENIMLNGQTLPVNTIWLPVAGTEYIGGYIPLRETPSTQTIHHANGTPFNAYLVGIGNTAMYGSALISNKSPETDTNYLKFSLDKTFCERTQKVGNYNSKGTLMEVTTVSVKPGKRKVSYAIKHLNTAHLQACQLMCFRYSNCTGVNYTDIPIDDVNCDIIFSAPLVTLEDAIWTNYKLLL